MQYLPKQGPLAKMAIGAVSLVAGLGVSLYMRSHFAPLSKLSGEPSSVYTQRVGSRYDLSFTLHPIRGGSVACHASVDYETDTLRQQINKAAGELRREAEDDDDSGCTVMGRYSNDQSLEVVAVYSDYGMTNIR